jgi:hypothetical protein
VLHRLSRVAVIKYLCGPVDVHKPLTKTEIIICSLISTVLGALAVIVTGDWRL